MNRFAQITVIMAIITMPYFTTFAKQISQNDAFLIASRFITKTKTTKATANNINLAYTSKSTINSNKNCFFVFNNGNEDGYIIVAADDCVQSSILGYSDRGKFDKDNMPSNFQWWLEQYKREIDYAIKHGLSNTTTIQQFATSVAPLLGNISWDQGDPYNILCPTLTNSSGKSERTVTGCVATATAQVMRYYKWPQKGTGSNSYTWKNGGKTLSMDFSKSTYDWNNMADRKSVV